MSASPTPNIMPKRTVASQPVLLVTRGISNSGKSTWARKWVAADPENRRCVNRDTIRAAGFTIAEYSVEQEIIVTEFQHAAIRLLLKSGKNVISDDTNLSDVHLEKLYHLALEAGARFEHRDFNITLEQALSNSQKRITAGGLLVEDAVITSMFERNTVDGVLRPFPEFANK